LLTFRWACFCLVALFSIAAAGWCPSGALAAEPARVSKPIAFALRDGDRVVMLGSTFIERDQTHGYLETALSGRFHPAKIQFRNLGWSGDTVHGEARAGFGSAADGFVHLKKHVLSLNPTVILLSYGGNESFAGPAGLETFLAGLDTLLKTLDATKAQIVFIAPVRHEDLGRPLPDPTEHNRNLKIYCDAIAAVAARRQAPFVNLFSLLGDSMQPPAGAPLTDNGIHLTDYGYWRAAPVIEKALGLPERRWVVELDAQNKNIVANGTKISDPKFGPTNVSFRAHDELLPLTPPPDGSPRERVVVTGPRILRVLGLAGGTYSLKVDGEALGSGTAEQWAEGVAIVRGPEFAQAEKLRRTIVAKNRLYFYRWRPQNETYLFGFRKHEQGNNAVEIPQFDPLIAEQEAAINTLSAPVAHEYQLQPVDSK